MSNPYYDELYQSEDPTRQAGWRHRLEQALRFEIALEVVDELHRAHLIDLGCGPGGLIAYLRARGAQVGGYCGVDALPEAIAAARQRVPDAQFLHAEIAAWRQHAEAPERTSFDVAVAIGALVDGTPVRSARARRRRARDLIACAVSSAPRGAAIVLTHRQEANLFDPLVFGVSEEVLAEVAGAVMGAQTQWRTRRGFLTSDVALYWWPTEEAAPRLSRGMEAHERVLSGPWAEDAAPAWVAWLWMQAGAFARAEAALARCAPQDRRAQMVRERMALLKRM